MVKNLLCLPLFVDTSTVTDDAPMFDIDVIMEVPTLRLRGSKLVD